MSRLRGIRAPGAGTLRGGLVRYFEERVVFYESGGGVRREADGGFTTYPGVDILDRLRRGAAVDLHGFYLVAGAKRAGIARPVVNPSLRYRVAPDGTFSEVSS